MILHWQSKTSVAHVKPEPRADPSGSLKLMGRHVLPVSIRTAPALEGARRDRETECLGTHSPVSTFL